MYRSLKPPLIVLTAERLCRRIAERFPEAGLSKVAQEVLGVARDSVARSEWLNRPLWWVRLAVLLIIVALVTAGVLLALELRARTANETLHFGRVTDVVQGFDAAVNEVILLAIVLFFLLSLEGRLKRRHALRALHQLRSLAHVVDMHQLTKDPDGALPRAEHTPSSPRRELTPPQLARYFDYCSELLSLLSKLAALHVQHLRDPVVLNAVNDVESLTQGLSQKIWQKIQVLETRWQPLAAAAAAMSSESAQPTAAPVPSAETASSATSAGAESAGPATS